MTLVWAILAQYWDKILMAVGALIAIFLVRENGKKSVELEVHKKDLKDKEDQIAMQIKHIKSIEREGQLSEDRMKFVEDMLRRKPAEDYTSEELNRIYQHPMDLIEDTDPGKK